MRDRIDLNGLVVRSRVPDTLVLRRLSELATEGHGARRSSSLADLVGAEDEPGGEEPPTADS